MSETYTPERIKYLKLLAEQFPNSQALWTEIINLGAIVSLPKGTEHFMSDIHGEYESFCHIMNNCSGVIREKVQLWLGDDMTGSEVNELCTLIYYPREKLKRIAAEGGNTPEWYRVTLSRLIYLARMLSSKYTRSKVRKAMPEEYAYILDELLHAQSDEDDNQHQYHETILNQLVEIGAGKGFIIAVTTLIKHLAVDHLHVVGDIFDRGPRADSILDMLIDHHSVDIEWGNHDVLWIGAASGSLVCIAQVVRNCVSYNNTEILEKGYGIPLRQLTMFATRWYPGVDHVKASLEAINTILFKLEGQVIRRNPDFRMEDRLLLDKIDSEKGTVMMEGTEWKMIPRRLPTVDPADPYALTAEEEQVMESLQTDFLQSLRLQHHVEFLINQGRLYLCYNDNLLYHGCVPMNEDGSFRVKTFGGQEYSGKALMDYADATVRRAWHKGTQDARDFIWYLWSGLDSPVCGRNLRTFARYFIEDKAAWVEPRNPYYDVYNRNAIVDAILTEFGMDPARSHIINGHTPIRVSHGESPLKADGKLIVIDGGFCRAYQKTTGIAGYTLITNSHGMRLMSHAPFTTLNDALEANRDIRSQGFEFSLYDQRRLVRDTDQGKLILERIQDLKDLLAASKDGLITLKKAR